MDASSNRLGAFRESEESSDAALVLPEAFVCEGRGDKDCQHPLHLLRGALGLCDLRGLKLGRLPVILASR